MSRSKTSLRWASDAVRRKRNGTDNSRRRHSVASWLAVSCLGGWGISGYFVWTEHLQIVFLGFCLPVWGVAGWLLYCFEGVMRKTSAALIAILDGRLAGFILFFLYIIGYILCFNLAVSMPSNMVLQKLGYPAALGRDFSLLIMNFAVIAALLRLLWNYRQGQVPWVLDRRPGELKK